jgi:ribose/xylose/arabinose/galactoside ABC-type transport system permease subunit
VTELVKRWQRETALVVIGLVLVAILAVASPRFLGAGNLKSTLATASIGGVLAIAEALVLLSGGLDLSVGAIAGVSVMLAGDLMQHNMAVGLACVVAVVAAGVLGLVNGALIGLTGLPPIIVTLGTLGVFTGLEFAITNGQWINTIPNSLTNSIGGEAAGLPVIVWIWLGVAAVVSLALHLHRSGRAFYAVGDNLSAAVRVGLPVRRVQASSYVIAGLLSGVAGLMFLAYSGFATPATGAGYELSAIAAAVVGGVSLSGGKGTVLGATLGALLLGAVSVGMTFANINALWDQAAEGFLLLFAFLADSAESRRLLRLVHRPRRTAQAAAAQ